MMWLFCSGGAGAGGSRHLGFSNVDRGVVVVFIVGPVPPVPPVGPVYGVIVVAVVV